MNGDEASPTGGLGCACAKRLKGEDESRAATGGLASPREGFPPDDEGGRPDRSWPEEPPPPDEPLLDKPSNLRM